MKKIFSIFTAFLMFFTFPPTILNAEEETTTDDTTTTTDDTTTTTEDDTTVTSTDDTTTTTDDDSASSADDAETEAEATLTTTEEDTTDATDETSDATTEEEEDSTASGVLGFLDNIDTMWLWIILGIGGVVLIGSLIGIVSLSKRESKGDKTPEIKPLEEQPKVDDVPSGKYNGTLNLDTSRNFSADWKAVKDR